MAKDPPDGYTLQLWMDMEPAKRTRIADAAPENYNRWMERYRCDQAYSEGASSRDDDSFGAQPSYGPAFWQVGKDCGGKKTKGSKSETDKKKTTQLFHVCLYVYYFFRFFFFDRPRLITFCFTIQYIFVFIFEFAFAIASAS
jgi:hypothetical protein